MIHTVNEETTNQHIQAELDLLCKNTASDFSGLAWLDTFDSRIRWLYASGNSNERFRRLAVKSSRGLAGLAIKLGRPIIIDANLTEIELARVQYDYPIMLVERLRSAIAVPIKVRDEMRSVLLIGNRSDRIYEESEINIVIKSSERFALLQ